MEAATDAKAEIKNQLKNLAYTVSQGIRVTQFLSQSILSSLALGRRPDAEQRKALPPTALVLKDLKTLIERDYQNIQAGIYKMPKDILPNPIRFSQKSFKVFMDLFRVKDRQNRKAVKEFSDTVPKNDFPAYYAQTFHFQTDGYLSDSSAELYDHQVELVFAGGADTMRRQALVPLFHYAQEFKKTRSTEVEKLKILDVACGTGRFLQAVKENFPDVSATGLDLSPWYLKKAETLFETGDDVKFVEANAESMPFEDEQFDVVTCIFLFHELPRLVRQKIATEMARVLKPGGQLIFVDSIQLGDKPVFDGSLKFFPVNYYEPYYLDYIEENLDALFESVGLKHNRIDLAFFSKILSYRKAATIAVPEKKVPAKKRVKAKTKKAKAAA